jgi:hypothetical protein
LSIDSDLPEMAGEHAGSEQAGHAAAKDDGVVLI